MGDRYLRALVAQARQVQQYISGQINDPHAAEDLVSEVYVVVWRRFEEIPEDEELAIGWLYVVARNVARNHVRSMLRYRRLVESAAAHAEREFHRHASARAEPGVDRVVARQAWGDLDEADRKLLTQLLVGESRHEIAEALGIERGSLAMRVLRARRRLARELDH